MRIPVTCTALLLVSCVWFVPAQAEMFPVGLTKPAPRIILADAASQKAKNNRNCPTVEIFVTSWCGYCKMMEKALDKKGVAYTTFDIEKNDRAAKIYRDLGGRGVPLVRVGSKVVYGYDPDTVISYVNGR
jgi:glutaredoxin